MKKSIRVFLFFVFVLSGNLNAQDSLLLHKVKFRIANRDLSNALVDLSKKSNVNIVFNIIDVPEKKVNLYAPNYTLGAILDYLLLDTKLKYLVQNKQIIVYLPKIKKNIKSILYGYITDMKTGEKLIYTTVYLPISKSGTVSNEYGFYSLLKQKLDTILVFSYLGYYSKIVKSSDIVEEELNVQLTPKPDKLLDQIIITDSKVYNKRLEFYKPEKIYLSKLEKMVHLGGEDDVMRFTYVKPGVLTGADGFGGIHVRGGNSGGNKVLLDGVPVYNSQHAIGLFSIFNSSIIKHSQFYKGDFPARYGGGLGSVMDIKTRNGNYKKFGGEVDLGLFTIKGLVEGPITDNKSSMIVSFRRTYIDIWSNVFSSILSNDSKQNKFGYYFYDLNLKMNFELNKRNRIHFGYYKGNDSFLNNSKEFDPNNKGTIINQNDNEWKWGNTLISIQWNSQISNNIFMNTSAFKSSYNLKAYSCSEILLRKESSQYFYSGRFLESDISDLGIKMDFDYSINNSNYLKWGLLGINHDISPFVYINSQLIPDISYRPRIEDIKSNIENYNSKSFENRIYVEDKINFGRKSILNIGLHYALYSTKDKIYHSVEPRIIFSSVLNKKLVLSASITKMSQFLHLLTNNGLGLPSEILLPSTKYLLPESVWQFELGASYEFNKNFFGSIQTYIKKAKNLVEQKRGSSFIISKNSNWEDYIPIGIGKMYGLETELKYNNRKLNFIFNYTYSKSTRSYNYILNGEPLDYRFSRKHYFNLIAFYKITDKMIFSLSSVYGSGNPYTLPTQLTPDGEFLYETPNNYKLPKYSRIDIGILTKFKVKGIKQELKLGVYNLLSRKNPFYIIFKGSEGQLYSTNFKKVYVFPIFPSIKYKVNF